MSVILCFYDDNDVIFYQVMACGILGYSLAHTTEVIRNVDRGAIPCQQDRRNVSCVILVPQEFP